MSIFNHFKTSIRRAITFIIETIVALVVELSVLNYLPLTEPSINGEDTMNIFQLLINNIGIVTAIILVGLLLYQLWYWHKKDEQLKREDFIDTLIRIQKKQIDMSWDAISKHVFELKQELKKDGFNPSSIPKFESHKSFMEKYEREIQDELKRLGLHKSDAILDKIRADEINKRIENESN